MVVMTVKTKTYLRQPPRRVALPAARESPSSARGGRPRPPRGSPRDEASRRRTDPAAAAPPVAIGDVLSARRDVRVPRVPVLLVLKEVRETGTKDEKRKKRRQQALLPQKPALEGRPLLLLRALVPPVHPRRERVREMTVRAVVGREVRRVPRVRRDAVRRAHCRRHIVARLCELLALGASCSRRLDRARGARDDAVRLRRGLGSTARALLRRTACGMGCQSAQASQAARRSFKLLQLWLPWVPRDCRERCREIVA